MAEQQIPQQVVSVTYQCDACGEGNMKPTNMVLTSNPPQYPHVCDKCGATQTFCRTYPYVRYVPISS
jgi:hypothetical protein